MLLSLTAKPGDTTEPVNCTVAYMSQCMSWNKCKNACMSMGASSYRWFHDGCCECVGFTCVNYGINESRFSIFQIKFLPFKIVRL